jgi:hypothetical protein
MSMSRNEIESLALKAARGAGLSWGLAEEAAAAAGWLAGYGLPWAEALADVLDRTGSTSPPRVDGGTVVPSRSGTALCPILTGAFLSDLGPAAVPMEIGELLTPAWIVPFAARVAAPDRPVCIAWAGGQLLVGGPDAAVRGRMPAPSAAGVRHRVTIAAAPGEARSQPPLPRRAAPYAMPEVALQRLLALEQRCYVPASMRSRLAGAGAGLLDND